LNGSTAPTFSATCAPVLELADSRDLHSRGLVDRRGPSLDRRGPSPLWGTNFSPNGDLLLYLCSMTKKTKRKRKKSKRGPHEERLVIAEHPQTALDKLLKKKPR